MNRCDTRDDLAGRRAAAEAIGRGRARTMTAAARTLAEFAVGLKYEAIPAKRDRARQDMHHRHRGRDDVRRRSAVEPHRDRVRAAHDGARARGRSSGTTHKARGQLAALANGALAHAFELDSLCHPSVGVHPGASLTAPGIPVSQAQGRSGRELLTAFVAGFEVMYRVGDAARHSSEKIGFHAPGLTGVFGGAVVTGLLMKLDADRMTNALGIAGSMCSGLLEFSRSGGGMVKRLHLGRAAEGGALAATLAREGFTGPETVLEGPFGFLAAFAKEKDPPRLTQGLGEEWHTLKTMLKRYACHITAHVPVTAALELKAKHHFTGADVASVTIAADEKVLSHHDIKEPQDTMMCQYQRAFLRGACTASRSDRSAGVRGTGAERPIHPRSVPQHDRLADAAGEDEKPLLHGRFGAAEGRARILDRNARLRRHAFAAAVARAASRQVPEAHRRHRSLQAGSRPRTARSARRAADDDAAIRLGGGARLSASKRPSCGTPF